ncbi:MAG: hypothetical protein SFY67_13315 [Candidatus Melainabacteria bacterium]|nr:hypothetical protein [Candidatus Melainabacteria bacterium]
MIQCPVCQVSNEPNSQFCRECGNRIERRSEPRPKLKSPLLSGYEEPETYDDEPNVSKLRGVKPAKPAKSPGEKPRLRSPLLRDDIDDDDDDESWDNSQQEERRSLSGSNTGKNKLRSPLLGEGNDDDDDYDAPSSSGGGMPRVRRKSSPSAALNPSMPSPNQDTGNQSGKGGKPKLRSRLLDTSDYEEYDDDWDEDEEKEDTHALRSPLLRARKHQDDKPERTVPPQQMSQAQQMAHAQPPAPAPVPTTPMSPLNPMNQPMNQPANPPASMVPPAQATMPMPSPHNPTSPTSSGIFAQQPSFQPPNLPAPTPEVPNQKPLQMPGQPDENYLPPPIPQRETTPPLPHPLANQSKVSQSGAQAGPDDRRSSTRRQSNTDRRSRSGLLGAGAQDDMDDDYPQSSRSGGSSLNTEQLKMVCLASICGAVFKVVYIGYIFMSFGLTPTSLWIILDQLAFIFVCVGLIMFSSQSMSSR